MNKILGWNTKSRSTTLYRLTLSYMWVQRIWWTDLYTLRTLLRINTNTSLNTLSYTTCLLQDQARGKTDLARDSLLGEERNVEALRLDARARAGTRRKHRSGEYLGPRGHHTTTQLDTCRHGRLGDLNTILSLVRTWGTGRECGRGQGCLRTLAWVQSTNNNTIMVPSMTTALRSHETTPVSAQQLVVLN